MPAIRASQKTASNIASVFKKGKGVRLPRDIAERCFLPAFGHSTATVPLPASLPTANSSNFSREETRRNFSSIPFDEHDKVREQWKAVDDGNFIDYWKVNQHEHVHLDDSEMVDYWADHRGTHLDNNASCKATVQRSFSANQSRTAPSASIFNGREIDYWTERNDSHYTDYWEEQPNTHV